MKTLGLHFAIIYVIICISRLCVHVTLNSNTCNIIQARSFISL